MRNAWTLQTPPASEPISTATAKAHLRVDASADDALIDALVKAARAHVEEITGRSVLTQTWEYRQAEWSHEIWLPRAAPLASVTTVKYYDQAGVEQTLDASTYLVDTMSEPGRLVLAPGQSWPAVQGRDLPITVRYVAGRAAITAADQPLVQAMLLLIAHWYEHRESVVLTNMRTMEVVPHGVDALLAPLRVYWREPKPC